MPATARVVTQYQRALQMLITQVGAYALATWDALGSWRDDAAEQWIAELLPVLLAGQSGAVALTDAYLAEYLDAAPIGLVPDELIGSAVRGGAALEEVYTRPFRTVWAKLAEDKPLTEAVSAGRARTQATVAMDMQLSGRAAAREGMARSGVVGYRRVVSGSSTCDLCAIASTQRYRTEDLLPIHNRCGCVVAPIVGERDPGQVINKDLLRELRQRGAVKDITEQRQRAAAKVATAEHGEVGPVLVNADHAFTGADDI